MRKRYVSKQNFILVSNLHGVDMFPKIGNGLLSELTPNMHETEVYDERDNMDLKARFWSVALKRLFTVREIPVACAS